MNEKGHVINAALLGVGVGVILDPSLTLGTARTVVTVTVPIVLGALFPDIDTTFGTHRRTFHNLAVLGVFVAFPALVDNLHYVWIGVATHYVLDLLGNVRGMALFFPYPTFVDVPVGVSVDSPWADVVTLAVTALELAALAAVATVLDRALLATPLPS
jgi:hypothetical protein